MHKALGERERKKIETRNPPQCLIKSRSSKEKSKNRNHQEQFANPKYGLTKDVTNY